MPPELWEEVDRESELTGLSSNAIVNQIIRRHYEARRQGVAS
jgi:hypothetical protein